MALDLGELVVRVKADTKNFRNEIGAAERQGTSFGKKMLNAAKGMVAAFGAVKLVGFLKGAVEEARASKKITDLTASAIRATGGAANVTAEQVKKLSTSLSNKTAVDDDVIQSGANMLLTFKNIRNETGKGNDIFNKATEAAVDLSAAGFGSVESASVMLGKALNDPIKGVTALQRVGVTLTDQQKEQVKAFVESGDVLSAQKVILQEIQSQVGGAAAAQANAADLMRVKWDNFREMIGSLLIPMIDKFLMIMVDRVLPAITSAIEWMQRNSDTIKQWATVIGAVLVPALAVWATASTVAAAKSVAAWVSAAVASTGSAATQSLSAAQVAVRWAFLGTQALLHAGKVAAAWVIAMGPWGLLVAAIVAAVVLIVKNWDTVSAATQKVWTAVRNWVVDAWKAIVAAVAPAVASILNAITSAWNTVRSITQTIWNGVRTVLETVWKSLTAVVTTYAAGVRLLVETAWNAIRAVTQTVWNAVRSVVEAVWNALRPFVEAAARAIRTTVETVWTAIRNVTTTIWNAISNFLRAFWTALRALFETYTRAVRTVVETVWTAIRNVTTTIWNAVSSFLQGIWNTIRNTVTSGINAVRSVVETVWGAIRNTTTTIWNAVSSKISEVWNTITRFVTDKVGALRRTVETTFTAIRDNVGRIWDGIVEKVKSPIRVTFSFINDKMVGPVNSILSKFPGNVQIPRLPHLARGGKVKGPGTSKSDSVPAMLSNGEYVIRADTARKLGTDFLTKLNEGKLISRAMGGPAAVGGTKVNLNSKGIIDTRGPYYGLYLSEALKKSQGYKRAEDGSWVNPRFYAKPGLQKDLQKAMAKRDLKKAIANRARKRPNDLAGRSPSHFDYGADQVFTTINGKRYRVNSRGIIDTRGPYYGLYVSQARKIAAVRKTGGGDLWDVAKSVAGGAASLGRGALDKIGDMASWTTDMLTKGAKWAAEKLLNPLRNAITGQIGSSNIVTAMLSGSVNRLVDGVLGKASEADKAAQAMGSGSGPGSWQWQIATLRTAFPGLQLISGFRPGAITATGNPSYHGKGRAVDVPPRMDVFNWIRANYGANTKELIFSPAGNRQIHNGKPHMYTGVTRANHWDHVHWAYDQGGWLKPGQRGVNHLGKPEAVLTPEQSKAFVDLAEAISRGENGMGRTLIYNAAPGLSLDSEADFIDATGRARMLGW